MTLRPAGEHDTPAIAAFLAAHPDTSMFLRSNLAQFGPTGGDAPHATAMWLAEEGGRLHAVLGISTAGYVMMQAPGLPGATARAFATAIADRKVAGIMGMPAQVATIRDALGLAQTVARRDDAEPLYALALEDLRIPDGVSRLRPPTAQDRTTLRAWRSAYQQEIFATPQAEADAQAIRDVDGFLATGRMRLLTDPQDRPLSVTGFNAQIPDTVQIGNVYTPPALRGAGHARRAVALHLAEARAAGPTRAILFAANPAACRAYEAIGFSRIGSYTLTLFDGPQPVRPVRYA